MINLGRIMTMKKVFIFIIIALIALTSQQNLNRQGQTLVRNLSVHHLVTPCPQKTGINAQASCCFKQCYVLSEFFSYSAFYLLQGLIAFIYVAALCLGSVSLIYKPPRNSLMNTLALF